MRLQQHFTAESYSSDYNLDYSSCLAELGWPQLAFAYRGGATDRVLSSIAITPVVIDFHFEANRNSAKEFSSNHSAIAAAKRLRFDQRFISSSAITPSSMTAPIIANSNWVGIPRRLIAL